MFETDIKKEKILCDVSGDYDLKWQYFLMPCKRTKDVGEVIYCTVYDSNRCKAYIDLHFSKLDKISKKLEMIEIDYDIYKKIGKID